MKTFIAVSCLLAVASAGLAPLAYNALPWAAPYAYGYGWAGPQHLPVIGPNGVPLDTPEVAAGKVANAVAHAEAHARNGDYIAPVAAVASPVIAARTIAPYHIPVIGPNGVPLDTPEVAHAKATHLAAHVDARLRTGLGLVHHLKKRSVGHVATSWAAPVAAVAPIAAPVAYAADYKWVGPQNIPVIGPNGVPLDTPEVAAAKAANAVAHVEAKARNGELIAPVVAPVVAARTIAAPLAAVAPIAAPIAAPVAYAANYQWVGPQHLPVIGPNGTPLDTPEVAAGKVANAVAHAEAHARNGDYIAPVAAVASPVIAARTIAAPIATPWAAPIAAPLAYAHGWAAPQHLPVIGPNGVPLDTPEVAAGKVANAVAHAEAKARNGDHLVW